MLGTGSSQAIDRAEVARQLHRLRSTLARLKGELELRDDLGSLQEAVSALREAFEVLGRTEELVVEPFQSSSSAGVGDAGSARVFVADDDRRLAELTARQLRRYGYEVTAADDLFALIDSVAEGDVLVVDFGLLSDLDPDAEQWTRQKHPIVMSGSIERAAEDKAKDLGASAYLVKPVEAAVLAQAIRRRLEAKRP